MPGSGGADAEFNVDINIDADKAAAELEAKIEKALREAFKSPAVQGAFNTIVTAMTKAMSGVGKSSAQTWKTVQTQGVQAAHNIGKAFDDVAKKSKAAFNANQARGSSNELQALNALVHGLSSNFEHLATDIRTTNTVIQEMSRGARAQLNAVTQEQRTLQQQLTSQNATLNTQAQERANKLTNQTKLDLAAIRSQSAADRNASNERIANIRRFTQIATTSIRALTQVFRSVFNAGTAAVRGFVNTAGSIIRGLASTFRSVFSTINGIVRSFVSGFTRAFSTIGRGVTTALSGVSRAIRSALSRDEAAVKESMSRRERAMSASAGRQQSIFSRAGATLGLLGGGAAIGSLLTSGFERAGQVEQLQLTFNALLGDSGKATKVLADLSEYARTTSFDFVEVAQSTAQLTAALGDVDKAESLTKFLGDVVALTGGTTESLGRVRLAMSQIAGAGRLDSANLRQITESLPGVPIAQILADRFFGGSMEAYSKARDAGELGGKISAEAFFDAFQQGTQERFPEVQGFAQVAAGTLTGLTQNLKENFAIFGATIITLVQGPLKAGIGAINNFMSAAGAFISGDMFKPKPVHAADNPYVQMADDALIAFEDLPKEWQRQLEEGFGWQAGKGFVVSKADAVAWWDNMHPPEADQTVSMLEKLRGLLGDFVKGIGAGSAVAAGFKAIGLALRFMVNPLVLAATAFGLLGVAWGKIYRASPYLQNSMHVLRYSLGGLVDAIKGLLSLAGRLVSNALFGNGNFWKSLGDRVSRVVNYLNRGIRAFTGWLNWANDMIAAGKVSVVLDDVNDRLKDLLGHLLGLSSAQLDFAKLLGGNDFGNILAAGLDKLETVPVIGPITAFVRRVFNSLIGAAKSAIGFFGDIWSIIFGSGGADDPTAVMVNSLFGGPSAEQSTGTKILDRLENTFLGPVVRFFRGPFANTIESIGGFIGGVFQDYIIPGFSAVSNFFAHDFIPGIVNIAESIGRFLSPAVSTVGNLLGQVGTLLAPLGGAIENFFSTYKDKGIGGAFSGLWQGVIDSASNLWEGVDGSGGIKAGLQSAVDSITNWFSTTFTGKNVETWIKSALDGIRKVGFAIGKFIGSPEFLGTVVVSAVAVAAAIAAVLGAFTLGLVQGLAKEGVRWGKLIAGALQDGWNNLTEGALSFVPQPIVDAVNAMLGNKAIGAGLGVGALVLGGLVVKAVVGGIASAAEKSAISTGVGQGLAGTTSLGGIGLTLAKGLFNSVVNGFKGVGKGALSLASYILPRFPTGGGTAEASVGAGIGSRIIGGMNKFFGTVDPVTGIATGLRGVKQQAEARFGNVGTAIATAVVGGIAAYEFGNYAGKKGDAGGILLALLGGAATGGAIGATFGGVGAGIGAAIGLGIAGLGVYFGQAAKKAQDFNDVVVSIRESLSGLSQDNANQALVQNISDRLTSNSDAFKDWGQQLSDSFDFGKFVQDILDGTATADSAFADFVTGMKDQLISAGNLAPDLAQKLTDSITLAAQSGDFQSAQDLLNEVFSNGRFSTDEITAISNAFDKLPGKFTGIVDGSGDAEHAFNFLKTTISGTAAAQAQLAANTDIVTQAMSDAANPIDTVDEALQSIRDGLAAGGTAQEIANILGNPDLSSANALDALSQAADDVKGRISDAKDLFDQLLEAMKPALPGPADKSIGGITDKIVADLPNIAAGFQQIWDDAELPDNIKNAKINLEVNDFSDQIAQALSDGFSSGSIDSQPELDTFIAGIRQNIEDANLSGPVSDQLNAVLDTFAAQDFSSAYDAVASALTDQQKLAETGRLMAQRIQSGIGNFSYNQISEQEDSRFGAIRHGQTPPSGSQVNVTLPALTTQDLSDVFKDVDSASVGHLIGGDVGDAVPSGFKASNVTAGLKSQLTATGAGLHGTASDAGQKIGNAIVKGMGVGAVGAASAGQSAGRAAVQGAAGGINGMFSIGANAGAAFAKGIVSQVSAAAQAAAAIASAAVKSARTSLQIHSPSKVFVDIGKQIGAGFVKGIEDSTTSMTDALEKALTDAVKNAVDKSADAVNRANVAGKLFEILQPSTLPGGTSKTAVTSATAGITSQLGSFTSDLRSGLSDALGGVANDTLREAREGLAGVFLNTSASFNDLRGQYADAKAAKKAIDDYNTSLAKLRTELANGTLASRAASRERGEAYQTVLAAQNAMNDKIARLGTQLHAGTLSLTDYKDKVQQLQESYQSSSVESYYAELDRINRAYKDGSLAQQEYRDQLDKLGSRPDALSFDQKNLLASGISTLNLGTIAGKANNDNLSDALGKIREFGQAALAAGTPLGTVITQMEAYTKKVTQQATAMGLSAKDVTSLVSAFGLTDAQLKALQASVVSLNTSTVSGAENVTKINEQLAAIREYGATLLTAGESTDSVVGKLKQLRNNLVAQAKAFGFNASAIDALVTAAGLSDTALGDFIKQLNDYTQAVKDAAGATPGAPNGTNVARPIGELHVHVPYGDPEAVALATANRIAYDSLTSWS